VTEVDVLVVGGGTAGEYAAGTLLGLKHSVAIAERASIGGDCIFHACIPTKTLAHAASTYERLQSAASVGLPATHEKVDYAKVKAYKDGVITPLGRGRAETWRKRGAVVLQGSARFTSPTTVEVGPETVKAAKTIVCTGSAPTVPPIPGLKESGFITNIEALELTQLPDSLAVIGGGPIGIELARVFSTFGCRITVYEFMPHVLPLEDEEVSTTYEATMTRSGIKVRTGVKVVHVERGGTGKSVTVEDNAGKQTTAVHAEILVATGRHPMVEGLNLEAAGVEYDRKGIKTDKTQRTTAPNIWAAGDVSGGLMFTYVAGEQGKTAALNCSDGGGREINYDIFPRATFGSPEVASVGLTEAQARERGWNVAVGKFEYGNLTRGIITGEIDGFVKVVAEHGSGKLLGAHIIGAEAPSLIHEVALAMKAGVPASEVGNLLHVYPAWAEGVRYACQAVD
jgi:pyruvate/2-oxoglutarate dehydrogenase complex dihydrolipoamide dehydrogenase (E3) component